MNQAPSDKRIQRKTQGQNEREQQINDKWQLRLVNSNTFSDLTGLLALGLHLCQESRKQLYFYQTLFLIEFIFVIKRYEVFGVEFDWEKLKKKMSPDLNDAELMNSTGEE